MPEEASTKKEAKRRRRALIPCEFRPRFWADSDARLAVVRCIKRRYELLKDHAGGDESFQRDLLCQRLAFISIILETQEVRAAEGGNLDLGAYVQAVNALQGLLKTLGLERRVKQAGDLHAYVSQKEKKREHPRRY